MCAGPLGFLPQDMPLGASKGSLSPSLMGCVTLRLINSLCWVQGQGKESHWGFGKVQEIGVGEKFPTLFLMLEMMPSFSQTEMDLLTQGLSGLWEPLCAN